MNTDRTLTAMYETRTAAESARDQLVGLGIASDAVAIRGADTETTVSEPEEQGFWASLFMPLEDREIYREGVQRGSYMLTVRVDDDYLDAAEDVLENSGAADLDAQSETWRQSGSTGAGTTGVVETATSTSYGTAPRTAARSLEGDEVIQAAEEQLVVGKREVGRGSVRVRSYVTERPVEEQVELSQERVTIERRPVNRALEPGEVAFQDRTIEAVERGEEAVVSKTARVTEEIGIRKDIERETETVRDTVRKQEIEVEDDRATGGATGTDTLVRENRTSR